MYTVSGFPFNTRRAGAISPHRPKNLGFMSIKSFKHSFYLLFVDGLPRLVAYYANQAAFVVGKVV